MKTKLISTCLVLCIPFVLLVLCSCGGGGGDDTLLRCGDGVIDTDLGETCDDGNTDDGDDCPADCILVSVSDICGDGISGSTEECDDANIVSEDGCSGVCKLEYCGDLVVQAGLGEQCDEGSSGGTTCSNVCQTITAEPEPVATETVCDDGLDDDSDGTIDCADLDCAVTTTCDRDGDGTINSADSDQDGDGLCDNESLCTKIDPQASVKNEWWIVDPATSDSKSCGSGSGILGGSAVPSGISGPFSSSQNSYTFEETAVGDELVGDNTGKEIYKNCCKVVEMEKYTSVVRYQPGVAGACIMSKDNTILSR